MLNDFNKFLKFLKPKPISCNNKTYDTSTDEGKQKQLNDLKRKVDGEFAKQSVGAAYRTIERMYNNIALENISG